MQKPKGLCGDTQALGFCWALGRLNVVVCLVTCLVTCAQLSSVEARPQKSILCQQFASYMGKNTTGHHLLQKIALQAAVRHHC